MSIESRVKARESAKECLDMIGWEATRVEESEHFWHVIGEWAARECGMRLAELPPEEGPGVMGYDEARRFEQQVIPYGMHKGKRVGDVEPDYWCMITESRFSRNLARYLRSRRFQEQLP